MNQVQLQATLIECKPLRFTPAGLAVLEVILSHSSQVIEAGHPRQVSFVCTAKAMGDIAQRLLNCPLHSELSLQGFLATPRKNATRLILHIQAFALLTGQRSAKK